MIVTQGGRRPCGCALYLAAPSRKTRSRHPGERRDVARRVSCAAVTLTTVSLCLCTGLRGELYHGACCDNKTMKLAQLPISSYPYALLRLLYVSQKCVHGRAAHTAPSPAPPPASAISPPAAHTQHTLAQVVVTARAGATGRYIIGRTSPRPIHDNARTRRTGTPSIGSPCPVDPR